MRERVTNNRNRPSYMYTRNVTVYLKGLDGKGEEKTNDAIDVVKQTLGERANRPVPPLFIPINVSFLRFLSLVVVVVFFF